MAIVRVIKDKSNPYVMLNKTCLCDDKLSWKAKGLHSYLLSLPDHWKIYISDLQNRSKDGRDSTTSAVNELMKLGYIKRTPSKDEKTGKFKGGYDYEVYEMPIEINESGEINRVTENPKSEKTEIGEIPIPENPKLVNNKLTVNNNSKYVSKEKNNLSLISTIYQDNIGPIYPANREWIIDISEKFEVDLFKRAIEICIDKSNVTPGYLKGILKKWDTEGILTLEQLKAKEMEYKNKKANKKNKTKNKDNKPKLENNDDEEIDPELLAEMKKQEELLGLN
ncbi:hypothetical protein TPELB_23830 [Terrisporobacter petrolearius]|uniref:DnaB/C C-terminal domain-containing protein n=1 Tax=Terrisporobacter petrolearius TaxID=1460447 RepID=A0ABZ3FHL7_9FIRM